jgi:hypothetical protein
MNQSDASYNASNEPPHQVEGAKEFPWQRLLLSVLFAFLGWLALWFTLALAVVYWILIAFNRDLQPDFGKFLGSMARYVGHCLGYVVMQREDAPFPVGPWPSAG